MKSSVKKVKSIGKRAVAIERNLRRIFLLLALTLFVLAPASFAQSGSPAPSPTPAASPVRSLERRFFANILKDQYAIWTSPFHLRGRDARWLAPLGAASAALFATDKRTAGALDNNETRLRISRDVSRFGTGYAVGGAAAAFYLIGKAAHNGRARETGLLAAEALVDSGIVAQTLKFATQRPRPLDKGGSGGFFDGGNSFPSGHSTSIWSLAAVIDGEYGKRHRLVRYGVYGLATAVSLSRYTGRNHFLSDVLVGSAIGYGVGHFVYLRHHDANLDAPDGTKKITKMEKYFPRIAPQYDVRSRTYAAALAWNF
jgi:membrane-associated phospholipid phosphatase